MKFSESLAKRMKENLETQYALAKAINVETVDLAPARIEKTTLRNNTAGATKETARISK